MVGAQIEPKFLCGRRVRIVVERMEVPTVGDSPIFTPVESVGRLAMVIAPPPAPGRPNDELRQEPALARLPTPLAKELIAPMSQAPNSHYCWQSVIKSRFVRKAYVHDVKSSRRFSRSFKAAFLFPSLNNASARQKNNSSR
jgi:hypothetical protein